MWLSSPFVLKTPPSPLGRSVSVWQMERLTQYLNEQQRRAEGREAVLRVQGLLSNLGGRVLAEPHRYLVKEGVLNVLVAEPPTRVRPPPLFAFPSPWGVFLALLSCHVFLCSCVFG